MTRSTATQTAPFAQQASELLNRLRIAYAALLREACGTGGRAVDLQRALNLDMKISWKVARVAGAPTPLAAGPYVPGPANARSIVKAGRRKGLDATLLDTLEADMAAFERFVKRCAGDRNTFDSMIYSLSPSQEAELFSLNQRKAAFRANRHLYGSVAQVQSTMIFIQPTADRPELVDFALVQGHHGLQRLREDAPLPRAAAGVRDDAFQLAGTGSPIPGDENVGPALLQEFCTQPLPPFEATREVNGRVSGRLVTPDIGMQAAVDWFSGVVLRAAAPRWKAENNTQGIMRAEAWTPCESFYLTLLIHRETYGPLTPGLVLLRDPTASLPDANEDRRLDHVLTAREQVQSLGRGPGVLHSPDLPRQGELAAYMLNRLGWEAADFDVYQIRFEYPVTPSTVFMVYDLPEAPST